MPQARRIKPVKKSEKPKHRFNLRLPWGLLLVVGVSAFIVFKLIQGAVQDDSANSSLGQGLKAWWQQAQQQSENEEQAIESLINEKSTPKEFEFYSVLPNIEQIMPDDLPEAEPTRAPTNLDYYLQAASFRAHADAEKLKAHLALKGYASVTQRRATEDNGVFYRVRLGPYRDKRKAKTAKNKLQKLGVRPFIFTVKKS